MMCALINVALHLQLLGGEDMEDCSKWLTINNKDKITLAVFCLAGLVSPLFICQTLPQLLAEEEGEEALAGCFQADSRRLALGFLHGIPIKLPLCSVLNNFTGNMMLSHRHARHSGGLVPYFCF